MGTRGCIARLTKKGFEGRYHHWDSYPEGLGKTLWDLYHNHFNHDLKAMLETLIDQHPAGWSTINGKDFNIKAGFVQLTTEDIQNENRKYKQPCCYCHGSRHEKEWLVTEKNASGSGVEWVYAFNEKTHEMLILGSYCNYSEDMKGVKMIGYFGCGDEKATWETIKTVDLEGTEPNWEKIKDNVMEESHKTYEENMKRKRERFLETMKEGYAQIKEFGLMAIPKAHYTLWYKEDVSKHLSDSKKIDLAKKISELTLRNPIWTDKETNYIKDFPELAHYSHTQHISGLQLCAVMEAIVREMQGK